MGLRQALSAAGSASWSDRRLYAESVIALARAAADLKTRKFRELVGDLDQVEAANLPPELAPAEALEAQRVAQAVRRCARNVPWEALCLCQALALTRMLKRRSIGGQVTLGSRMASAAEPGQGRHLTAHAWVSSGKGVLLGGERSPDVFTGLVSYRWAGR